jgi:hypothetical protein
MRGQEEAIACFYRSVQLHFSLLPVSATWMNSQNQVRFMPVEGFSHPNRSKYHCWRSFYGDLTIIGNYFSAYMHF